VTPLDLSSSQALLLKMILMGRKINFSKRCNRLRMKQSDQASCLENLGRVGVGEDKLRDNMITVVSTTSNNLCL